MIGFAVVMATLSAISVVESKALQQQCDLSASCAACTTVKFGEPQCRFCPSLGGCVSADDPRPCGVPPANCSSAPTCQSADFTQCGARSDCHWCVFTSVCVDVAMDCAASCAVMSQFNCSLADNFCSWCGLGCVAKDTCSCENITDVFQCTASADCVWCDRCRSFDDCARHAADTLIIIVSCTLGGIFLLCCVAVIVIVVAQRSRRARAGQIVVNNASYGATPASTYPGVAYRAQPAASVPQQQQQQQQRGQMPYVQPAYGAPAPLPAQPTPTPSAPAFVGQAAPTDRTPLMSGVDAI